MAERGEPVVDDLVRDAVPLAGEPGQQSRAGYQHPQTLTQQPAA